jgi:nitroreductase
MAHIAELITARFGLPSDVDLDSQAAGRLADILARRSYRRYLEREVPESLRTTLLACAQSASAKSDLQQYSIIDVRDQGLKDRLSEISGMAFVAKAPVVLIFCGDLRRARRITELRGKTYAQNNADSFMNAAVDAALAMQSYVLAAESQGLGCCGVSQIRRDMDATCSLLGIPKGVYPICGLTAGWPDEQRDISLRLPPAAVVHRDGYSDDAFEENIDAYDQRRHAIRPILPENYLQTEDYPPPEFYGWSEQVSRRLCKAGDLSAMGAFLKRHGFDLS